MRVEGLGVRHCGDWTTWSPFKKQIIMARLHYEKYDFFFQMYTMKKNITLWKKYTHVENFQMDMYICFHNFQTST